MAELQDAARQPTVLDDPSTAHVARVYAVSLLDAAGPDGIVAVLEEYRSFVDDLCAKVPDLERLLTSPSLTAEHQVDLIDRIIAPRATPLFTNFLRVLIRHRRSGLLRQVLDLALRESERRAGKRRIQVRSATGLSDDATRELTTKLQAAIAAVPILETTVDPSLLGGLIVRIGDTVYDGSLRTRLQQLKVRLRERYLHEIQRGRDRFSHPAGN